MKCSCISGSPHQRSCMYTFCGPFRLHTHIRKTSHVLVHCISLLEDSVEGLNHVKFWGWHCGWNGWLHITDTISLSYFDLQLGEKEKLNRAIAVLWDKHTLVSSVTCCDRPPECGLLKKAAFWMTIVTIRTWFPTLGVWALPTVFRGSVRQAFALSPSKCMSRTVLIYPKL